MQCNCYLPLTHSTTNLEGGGGGGVSLPIKVEYRDMQLLKVYMVDF